MAQLILECLAGDEKAIERLFQSHHKLIFRLSLSILDDADEAEDATQEALMAALRALDTYRGDSSLTTWLQAITVNVCRSRLRKRRTLERLRGALRSLFLLSGEEQDHPEQRVIHKETDLKLWKAVQALNEKHRLPVILRYYHDLPISKIAEVLGISQGTIHSRLYTARKRLRDLLKEESKFPKEASDE